MDLFKSIFAESSSDSEISSSESDMESDSKQVKNTPSNSNFGSIGTMQLTEKRQSRWQDLSVVTMKSPMVTTLEVVNSKPGNSSKAINKHGQSTPVNKPSQLATHEHATILMSTDSNSQKNSLHQYVEKDTQESLSVLEGNEEKVQNYGPTLPPGINMCLINCLFFEKELFYFPCIIDYVAAEGVSKYGDSATKRRQSDSSKHKRKHSDHWKKSHRKEVHVHTHNYNNIPELCFIHVLSTCLFNTNNY